MYTDEDLRIEAARQHAALSADPDFMGVGEQMRDAEVESLLPPEEADGAEGAHWGGLLSEDDFKVAQNKIADLIGGAADCSLWAVNLGADGLEPEDHTINMEDGSGEPLMRMHFAFAAKLTYEERNRLMIGFAKALTGTDG
jgi:hypothetical protein